VAQAARSSVIASAKQRAPTVTKLTEAIPS
jgi:hypothetical protein